jgi:DNA polymerase III subunit delta
MTEITRSQLDAWITKTAPAQRPAVWLIHGEQLLVERSAASLVEHLLAGGPRELGSIGMEGMAENIPDLLEQMNTFGLLSADKVIVFKDARLFEARGGSAAIIQQIEQAAHNQQPAKAGRHLRAFCSRSGINPEDLQTGSDLGNPDIKTLRDALGAEILHQVVQHALTQSGADAESHVDALLAAIEKGFPTGHHLVITVYSKAPKNYKLYKCIAKQGVVIDCSVPAGERRADKTAQEAVLRESWEQQLRKAGKAAGPGVFEAVSQLTGFDLANFYQGTEKLIDYAGDRAQISVADVHAILHRTKTDPVYELTNAVAERNLPQALFFLNSLSADLHPLQIVAALANQMRKLLLARDFIDSEFGRAFSGGISYPQFQQQVMPAVLAYDAYLQKIPAAWQEEGAEQDPKAVSELRLAPQPKNAYPVYQTLTKAHKFSQPDLIGALDHISRADMLLKSTGRNATLVLTQVLQAICRAGR